MNKYKITFSDLKFCHDVLTKGEEVEFLKFLNSFRGNNIYDKFKRILNIWSNDVSYTLDFNIGGKKTQIQLDYILNQLNFEQMDKECTCDDNISVFLNLPSKFSFNESIPIYDMVERVSIDGLTLDLTTFEDSEKNTVLGNLPANIYSDIMKDILKDEKYIFTVDHSALRDFKLNFLTIEPYVFLKGLFSNFDEDYFINMIYYISPKIGGVLLKDSTPLELEQYIKMYKKESEDTKSNPSIDKII